MRNDGVSALAGRILRGPQVASKPVVGEVEGELSADAGNVAGAQPSATRSGEENDCRSGRHGGKTGSELLLFTGRSDSGPPTPLMVRGQRRKEEVLREKLRLKGSSSENERRVRQTEVAPTGRRGVGELVHMEPIGGVGKKGDVSFARGYGTMTVRRRLTGCLGIADADACMVAHPLS